jgi:hypothetical protein
MHENNEGLEKTGVAPSLREVSLNLSHLLLEAKTSSKLISIS